MHHLPMIASSTGAKRPGMPLGFRPGLVRLPHLTSSSSKPGNSKASSSDLLVAVCISGRLRSFTDPRIYRNIFHTMVEPLRPQANVFMALDPWAESEVGLGRRQELPAEVMALFRPAGMAWGHISTPDECYGADSASGCAYSFEKNDSRCVAGSDQRLGQAYHLWRVYHLVITHEARDSVLHNWFLRLRPDEFSAKKLPPLDRLPRYMIGNAWLDPTLLVGTLITCGGTCPHDGWALMTREVAKVYMAQHFEEQYTYPQCLERHRTGHTMYSRFQFSCPECRLALSLRTRVARLAVCHANQHAGHPNQEFLWLARSAIVPGQPPGKSTTTPARFDAAFEHFRIKADLGDAPDWRLPTLQLPDTRESGVCWSDPTNVSFSAQQQFQVRLGQYAQYAVHHWEYWEENNRLLFGPCDPKVETCPDSKHAAAELARQRNQPPTKDAQAGFHRIESSTKAPPNRAVSISRPLPTQSVSTSGRANSAVTALRAKVYAETDVQYRPGRCATLDRDPTGCSSAHVGEKPCTYHQSLGKCRVAEHGDVFKVQVSA